MTPPVVRQYNFRSATRIPGSGGRTAPCRVYWGSHGCMLERGHDGDCICSCAFDEHGQEMPNMHTPEGEGNGNVGNAPYYGGITRFYGEDADARGLDTSLAEA